MSLIWLNLAMLPCAMAMGQQSGCPECPSEQDQSAHAHHQSSMDSQHEPSMHASHEHGSAEASVDCDTLQGDCCDLGEFSVDDRNQKPGKGESQQFAATLAVDTSATSAQTGICLFPTGPPDPLPATRPLHLINCVFLK